MSTYNVGNLIKRLRKQKGLTQEELAHPLIDRATLSRIESGRAMPGKKTLEALLEKLGFKPNNIADFFLDGEMTEIQKVHNELDGYLVLRQVDTSAPLIATVDTLISKLESNKRYMQNELNQQFVLISKAMNAINKHTDSSIVREILMNAIRITIPEFDEKNIEDYHLSKQDMKVINMLAMLYQDEGKHEKAIEIFYNIKRYLENHCIDNVEMGLSYPVTIYNLALQMYYISKNDEAIELCDIGSKVCRDTRSLFHLPLLTFVKACCLQEMGDKKESERLVRQAYHAFDMYELHKLKDTAKEMAKDTLGIDL